MSSLIMKFSKRFIAILFAFAVFVLLASYIFIQVEGKDLTQKVFEDAFDRPVHVGAVQIFFPFGIRFDKFEVPGVMTAKVVDIQMVVPALLMRKLVLSQVQLEDPVFIIHRDKEGRISWGQDDLTSENKALSAVVASKDEAEDGNKEIAGRLFIEFLECENGTIRIYDTFGNQPRDISLEKIQLKLRGIAYPFSSTETKFEMEAQIFSEDVPFSGGRFHGKGWANLKKKDMEGNFQIVDIDGHIDLSSQIKSVDNEMMVAGDLDLEQKNKPAIKEIPPDSLGDFLMDNIQSSGLGVKMHFAFKTKMDDFRINNVQLSGTVSYEEGPIGAANAIKQKIEEQIEALGKKLTVEPPAESSPGIPSQAVPK